MRQRARASWVRVPAPFRHLLAFVPHFSITLTTQVDSCYIQTRSAALSGHTELFFHLLKLGLTPRTLLSTPGLGLQPRESQAERKPWSCSIPLQPLSRGSLACVSPHSRAAGRHAHGLQILLGPQAA